MKKPDPALARLLVFIAGLLAIVVVLIVLRRIFLPLFLGLGIAYLFDPAVSWLERHGWSRVWGVVALTVLLLLVLVGVVLYLVPAVGEQITHLRDQFPRYSERLREQLNPWLERLRARYPVAIEQLQTRLVDGVKENWPRLVKSFGAWVGGAFASLGGFFLFLLNLVFVPVFAFYLLVDFPKLKRGILGLIPVPYREVIHERLREVDQAVSSFLRGQLTIAIVLAAINSVGLLILGVPLGLLIGILSGIANMIPYMALVVGLLPAMVLCWVEYQSWGRVLAVVAVFSGAQLLEGTVLSPRILGKSVQLHPVWVLLAILVGGSLFGFFGVLLAVPIAAAIHVFTRHWLAAYRQSRLYRAQPAATSSGPGDTPA